MSHDIRHHDCEKVPHTGGGYLHAEDDDRPYDVDGVAYCGRCHRWINPLPRRGGGYEGPSHVDPPTAQQIPTIIPTDSESDEPGRPPVGAP